MERRAACAELIISDKRPEEGKAYGDVALIRSSGRLAGALDLWMHDNAWEGIAFNRTLGLFF